MLQQIKIFAILSIVGLLFISPAFCAENAESEPEGQEVEMTQGQLAVAIVRSLGLEDDIGFDQTVQGYLTFLQGRGIMPIGGWDANAPVTKEVLAVVVVQTLGQKFQIQNKTDTGEYIRFLEERDISFEDVTKVLSNIFVVNTVTEIVGERTGGTIILSGTAGF